MCGPFEDRRAIGVKEDRSGVTAKLFGFVGAGGAARATTGPKGLIWVVWDAALKGPLFHGGARPSCGARGLV
jgi:hypothetical protein